MFNKNTYKAPFKVLRQGHIKRKSDLFSTSERMVEARNISHDSLLVRFWCVNNI